MLRKSFTSWHLFWVLISIWRLPVAWSGDPGGESLDWFEKKIRPVFLEHCVECHGPKKQKGGLRLDSRQGWERGGDSGPAIIPGEPEGSRVFNAIRYQSKELEMPPAGKLPHTVIEDFERWIRLGAVDPRSIEDDSSAAPKANAINITEGKAFWCFQPIVKPPLPEARNKDWPISPIDFFILNKLESLAIEPAAEADAQSLLRRVYYDLLGLPPSPEQIDAFLGDPSPNAYESLVENLLNSPHFGERWGRHWLDVVRFAESSGGGRTLLFPEAWRYRDYVVQSFNRDVPYDRFIVEQLAGDLLETSNWEIRGRNLIATAFLILGPTNYELQDKSMLELDIVDEQLDTMGKAFMGMTLGCARCHDHKFDPIPTLDYYAMAGILKNTRSVEHANVSKWHEVPLPLHPDLAGRKLKQEKELATLEGSLRELKTRYKALGGVLDSGDNKNKPGNKSIDPEKLPGLVIDDTQATVRGDWQVSNHSPWHVGGGYLHDRGQGKGQKSVEFRTVPPGVGSYEVQLSYTSGSNRSTKVPVSLRHSGGISSWIINQRETPPIEGHRISLGLFHFDSGTEAVVTVETHGTGDGHVIADAVLFINQDAPEPPHLAGDSVSRGIELNMLLMEIRNTENEIKSLKASLPVSPLVMAVEEREKMVETHVAVRGVAHNQGELAPRGVLQVATLGAAPEFPDDQSGRLQLAEWLTDASHPLTSRVMVNRVWYWLFGQGLVRTVDNFGATGDRPSHPELLDYLAVSFMEKGWSVKKMIKEIVLSRTYRMSSDPSPRAFAVDPDNRFLWRMNRKRLDAEGIRDSLLFLSKRLDLAMHGPNIKPGTTIEYGYEFDSPRRSVYLPVFRNTLPEIFEIFDFADPNIQVGKRTSSNISTQALLLMNHPFILEQSEAMGRLLSDQSDQSVSDKIRYVYRLLLGRNPAEEELRLVVEFLNSNQGETGWSLVCQTLIQSMDFRYLN